MPAALSMSHQRIATPAEPVPVLLPAAVAELFRKSAARTAGSGQPDAEAIACLRGSGILATAVPVEYGGAGGDAEAVNEITEQLATVNPSLAIVAFQHFAVSTRIAEWGSPEQRARLLPALAAGELLAASAWSEPGVGAAKKKLNTTAARLSGNRWLLNGAKSFTTSAGVADIYLVLAQTSAPTDEQSTDEQSTDDEGSYGSSGQTFFLVRSGNPGLVPDSPLDLLGMRGSATGFVSLRDCTTPDQDRLGPEGGAATIIAGVRETGVTLGAVAVGIARSMLAIGVSYAGRAEGPRRQLSRYRLIELSTQVTAAHALVCQAGRRTAADPGLTTLHSKLFASAVAERVGAEVGRMLGSAGYLASHELNRLVADARAVALMGPANDLCRELISANSD
jgi:alkylation response protein AidB-like acyl-CoA dehydrogenase